MGDMIQDYTAETVTHRRWASTTGANEPVFTNASVAARIEHKRRMTYNGFGQLVLSEMQIFTDTTVDPRDRFIVDGTEWPIKSTAPQHDLDGAVLWTEVRL